jgi:bloom syndrome protein
MTSSPERERERSLKLLSDARMKRAGYDSQATRHTLAQSVAALCPTIKPYDWQLDVAEAVALGLDTTLIAGTGSGKTLPWALPLLLEENCDKICLVISPLNELETDHVRRRRTCLKK